MIDHNHLRFLSRGASLGEELTGTYDFLLVAISIAIASAAGYAALQAAERVAIADDRRSWMAWLTTGSFVMGVGIWCMHFVGMLAFRLPVPVRYDLGITAWSVLPAIIASGAAISLLSRTYTSLGRVSLAGLAMAGGIGTMHYVGMAAMITSAKMAYDPVLFVLSIVVAFALATGALSVKFLFKKSGRFWETVISILMGCAVAGMHYSGMAAARYFLVEGAPMVSDSMTPLTQTVLLIDGPLLLLAGLIAGVIIARKIQQAAGVMRDLIEAAPDAIVSVDQNGNIRVFNRQAELMFGHDRGEALGQPLEFLLPERFRKTHLQHRAGYSNSPSTRRMGAGLDLCGLRKDGTEFPVDISLSSSKTESGTFVTSIIRDISQYKRMQATLLQSEKMSAVGQLAAGVAHEINNPLGIILGFAQSLAKKVQNSDPLALPIKSIEREALRCKNLVQNLLTFSRQNNARMERLDLNAVVLSVFDIVEARARIHSVEIIKELGSLEPLSGDKSGLQQVIVNLCNNAIDAMPSGGKIAIRTRLKSKKDREEVILEVVDMGTGIPKDIQDKIFNPFFTTKEAGKGTGLGLSLVYEIVQKHQGKIEVQSEVGRGTTFSVFLPGSRK